MTISKGQRILADARNPTPPKAPPVAVVPLPASLGMLLAAMIGLIGWRVAT